MERVGSGRCVISTSAKFYDPVHVITVTVRRDGNASVVIDRGDGEVVDIKVGARIMRVGCKSRCTAKKAILTKTHIWLRISVVSSTLSNAIESLAVL